MSGVCTGQESIGGIDLTIKECKEWLSRARKTDEEINALMLEQERALTNATSTVAQSGSEKVQTSNVNTSENKFISYAVYSELIDKRIDRLYEIKKEILENVNKLDDATLRTILILRYLNFQTWEMIACRIHYSYKQVCRLHGKALNLIKDVIECPIAPVI